MKSLLGLAGKGLGNPSIHYSLPARQKEGCVQPSQRYMLTIQDLFTTSRGALCGAEAVVAILDSGTEIDRLNFKGKVGPGGDGYRRIYNGKPGLAAQIVTGPGSINFQAVAVVDLTPAA